MALRFNRRLVALLATALLLGCSSPAPPAPESDSTPRPQREPALTSSQATPGAAACSETMVFLPAVAALFGTKQPTEPWMGQLRRVEVAAFCMDVYEHPNQQGSLPTVSLRWDDAAALCRGVGKRLCTADEWERACRGAEGRRFGYGEEFRRDICNTPVAAGGPGPGKPVPLAASGSHARCHTPEMIFDLDGNVSEYVSDPWDPARYGDHTAGLSVATFQRDPTVYNFEPDTDGPNHPWHTVRGSTMWTATDYGMSCLSRHGHPGGSSGIDDGFRCCSDPLVKKQ